MNALRNLMSAALLAGLVGLSAASLAQSTTPATTMLTARLSGASEVPPAPGSGSGTLQASLDRQTRVLIWSLTITGLSGPPTAAQLHGPAAAGENAGVAVPITVGLKSPDSGSVTLTSAQVDDLMAGKWYVKVHTAANPNGEIRGQVMIGS
jgi:CHRD domain